MDDATASQGGSLPRLRLGGRRQTVRGVRVTATQGLTIHEVLDEGLGNQSYVVGLADGRALVVDPSRDAAPYLQIAKRLGLRVDFAVETHLHADFISGGRELAAHGARLFAPGAAELQTTYQGLADGDELDIGGLTLRAIATPGHTPEHLAYLVLDRSMPLALFSGGALIPGGAARPHLIRSNPTQPLAPAPPPPGRLPPPPPPAPRPQLATP